MRTPAIYVITNRLTGKKYVGKTVKGVAQRWSDHKSAARCGEQSRFYNSIRKHGEDNFDIFGWIELGERFQGEKEIQNTLNDLEKGMISITDSNNKDKGYNCTEGGDGVQMTPEIRAKIGAAHKGKTISPEQREKNRIASTGKTHVMSAELRAKLAAVHIGRKASAETREKLRVAHLGKTPWNKGKRGLQVPWNKGKPGLQVAWNKGKHGFHHWSAEERSMISEALKGRPVSSETSQDK